MAQTVSQGKAAKPKAGPAAKKPVKRKKARAKNAGSSAKRSLALVLVLVLLAGVLGSALLAVPGVYNTLENVLGITGQAVIPAANGGATAKVHFIDVGQGDAVLLEDRGEYALIDAGPSDAEEDLLSYLDGVGVKTLRYVVMSHPHADHIGGMEAVVEAYEVQEVLLPNFELAPYPTTRIFESLLDVLLKWKIKAKTLSEGDTYPLGEGSLQVVHGGLATEDEYNLLSTGLVFESGGLHFFTAGDAEKSNERAMLEDGAAVRANLYKAGHHGSASTSNTRDFLKAVSPDVVVITCGENNSYGHPHRKALELFDEMNANILRTDQDGSVIVWPEEDGLHWATEKNAAFDAA